MKRNHWLFSGLISTGLLSLLALTLLLGACTPSGPEDPSRKIIHALPGSTVLLEYEGLKVTAADVDAEVAPDLERMRDEAVRSYRTHALARVKAQALDKNAKSQGFSNSEEMLQTLRKKATAQVTDAEVANYLVQNHLKASSNAEIRKFLEEQAWLTQKSALERSLLTLANLTWKIAPARYTLGLGLPGMAIGKKSAQIEIQEFCDFANPLCSSWNAGLRSLTQKYPGQVKWVFHPLPSHEHSGAENLALGAICAGRENRFLEYSSAFFQNPGAGADGGLETLIRQAGLNEASFKECMKDAGSELAREQKEARESGVIESPTVFVNGERAGTVDEVVSRIALQLKSVH